MVKYYDMSLSRASGGDPCLHGVFITVYYVFPARAGVIPASPVSLTLCFGLSRASGGDPHSW